MNRLEYYLGIARKVAEASHCSRRKFGAVIVKDDVILSTGYCGSARGTINCGTEIKCLKDLHNEAPLKSYDHCPSIHSEMNAIINAARSGVSVLGATLYLAEADGKIDRPCFLCRRFMIQAGLSTCVFRDKKTGLPHVELVSFYRNLENWWMRQEIKNVKKS